MKKINKVAGRVSFVYGVVFLSLSALLFRLAYLQVSKGTEFRSTASNQQISYVPVMPERGWIYDSNHQLLAYDTPTISIVMTRLHNDKVQNYTSLAKLLAPVLGQSQAALVKKMQSYNTWQDQIYLLPNATDAQVSYVSEHKNQLPGIELVVSSKRTYRHGNLAGQVLGYVGAITADEKKKYVDDKKYGYLMDQIVGQSGIESEYEQYLQGKPGKNAVVINNMGIPIQSLGLNPPPTRGDTLQLTVDGHFQAQTQQILNQDIDTLNQKGNDVHEAAAVAMDPKTGAVLAMASYPYLDPNWFMDPTSYKQHEHELNTYPSPAYNNVTQGVFMPGSTVKPGNILLGLLSGVITPSTVINDTGVLMIGNYPMHGDEVNGAGPVNPVQTIQVSDDIFMYQMALWMAQYPPTSMSINTWLNTLRTTTLNKFHKFEQSFGLGTKTEIDLPSESLGHFSDYKTLYDLPATAIGQDQAFTPLQLADYVSTIANSGKRMQPHLMQSIMTPSGQVIQTFKPKVLNTVKAPANYWDVLHQGMHLVTNSSRGTASGSFLNAPYQAAGKTGTAQQGGGKNDIAVFIGYAPYDNPQIAVAVVIPGGGYGATASVPVARDMMDAYFKEHHEFFPKAEWTNTNIPN
jgi:penicillin-binding protein 2